MAHAKLVRGHSYKIIGKNKRPKKGKLQSVSAGSVKLNSGNGRTFDISFSEIENMKKAKFSLVKTIGLPTVIIDGIFGLFLISDPVSIHLDGMQFSN